MASYEKYFKILRRIDPSMARVHKYKKKMDVFEDEQPKVLLMYAIEMIDKLNDKIDELRKELEFNGVL